MTFIQSQKVSGGGSCPKTDWFYFWSRGCVGRNWVSFWNWGCVGRKGKPFHTQTYYLYPYCKTVEKLHTSKGLWGKYGDRICEEFGVVFCFLSHKAILYSYNSFLCGFFFYWWSDTSSFSLEVVASQSISGAQGRRLNAVQAHFSVSYAVLAQDNQRGQLSTWVVTSRACAMKRTTPLQPLRIALSCQLCIQEQ